MALPPGVEFAGEPTASAPRASMLRLRDDGSVPHDLPELRGLSAPAIAFDWHPSTRVLWGVVPGKGGDLVLRPLSAGGAFADAEDGGTLLCAPAGTGREMGALRFQGAPEEGGGFVSAFITVPGNDALSVVTFAEPVSTAPLLAGMFGRLGDMATGAGGTLFLVTRNGERAAEAGGTTGDLLVRLTPRAR